MTKITYLGHACLLLENKDLRLLQDPWLEGPAYFNSWFHFPPSVPASKIPKPTHIYVSHSHQDHLSKETLSKFDKDTEIILADVEPEFKGQPPVKDQIESLGFKNIVQLASFESRNIGNTKLTMFVNQYDSGICIQDDRCTVLNTNDCIIEPLMGKIKARFAPIDIAFMLPIAANAFPQCYTLEDLNETRESAKLRDIARFIQRTIYLQPKVVVPYACMYTHFIKELDHLKDGFNAYDSIKLMRPFIHPYNKAGPKIKPVLMAPGDYWTTERGYSKTNRFSWKRIKQEYNATKKVAKKILESRIKNGNELVYTSNHNSIIEIKKISEVEKNRFQTGFVKFMEQLFTITNNDPFKVKFDFGWYKPVINFREKTITNSDKRNDGDVYVKLSPELFDFFIKNPSEWGNIMLSYRIRIKIRKGHRNSEHTLQKYLMNAYSISK